MKRTKLFFLFAFVVLLFGCSRSFDYEYLADQITNKTANQLKRDKGLRVIGTGGSMMGDIQLMGISCQYFQLVNLEESRVLVVYAAKTYLKNINENKEIRPYLHNYPFTVKNIEITIWINKPDGYPPGLKDIQCIALRNGIISYELTEPSKFEPWPILHQETYEEALKILEENPSTAKNAEITIH